MSRSSLRVHIALAGSALFLAVASGACEAHVETECVGGDGVCSLHQLGPAASSSATTGAGGGGGGCSADHCEFTDSVSGRTGEFPCAIEPIMDNCRRCHTTPLMNFAPFPLDTYEESQQLTGTLAIWYRMKTVVESDFMPLDPPKLTDAEKDVLFEWICDCAPPRDPGEVCP